MMITILNQLKEFGVHSIISDEQIILEILEDNISEANQIDGLINDLLNKMENRNLKKVLLECPRLHLQRLNCTKAKMKIKGERVIYRSSLRHPINIRKLDYEVWPINERKSVLFLSEVMDRNIDDTAKFLMSMKTELPSQVQRMFTVYVVENEPVGVVFPHLEPDRDKEGRIFWIGIHPKFQGRGLGKDLHLIGLYRLRNDFNAVSYLGATEINNNPMRKIMIDNGCIESKNTVISLVYSG